VGSGNGKSRSMGVGVPSLIEPRSGTDSSEGYRRFTDCSEGYRRSGVDGYRNALVEFWFGVVSLRISVEPGVLSRGTIVVSDEGSVGGGSADRGIEIGLLWVVVLLAGAAISSISESESSVRSIAAGGGGPAGAINGLKMSRAAGMSATQLTYRLVRSMFTSFRPVTTALSTQPVAPTAFNNPSHMIPVPGPYVVYGQFCVKTPICRLVVSNRLHDVHIVRTTMPYTSTVAAIHHPIFWVSPPTESAGSAW
jgi:hypothetical protein